MAVMVEQLKVDSVDRTEVLRYLGHRGQEVTPELEARLDAAVARCLEVARPRACLRSFDVAERTVRGDGTPELRLKDCALCLEGASIAEHLAGAVAVGVMAVTLGVGVDQELRRLSLTDPLGQVLFDAAATAAIERAADAAEALLVADAAAGGLHTNWRFSPGYGDLPLFCQPTLLAALDAQRRLGVTLTPSMLMVPTKSVTAVVGYFDSPQVGARPGCAACNLCDWCTLRKAGTPCTGGLRQKG